MKNTLLLSLIVFISCEEILTVQSIEDKSIELLSPADNSIIKRTSARFSWSTIEDADHYLLQVFKPTLEDESSVLIDTLITDNYFINTFTEDGKYSWRVRGENSGFKTPFTTANFELVRPNLIESFDLLSPSKAAEIFKTETLFAWEPVSESTQYRFQLVSPDFDAAKQFFYDSIIQTNNINLKLSSLGDYQWRVRAENENGKSSYVTSEFSVLDPLENKTITLLSPSDSITLKENQVIFNWDALSDVSSYRIQIATPNFDSPSQYILDSIVLENQLTFLLSDHTSYQWRINGIGPFSETSFTTRSFSIASISSIASQTVQILAPINNSILSITEANLNWTSIKEADRYHIQVATPSFTNANQIIIDQEVSNNLITVSLQVSTTYEWRVSAINQISETNYTNSIFKTK